MSLGGFGFAHPWWLLALPLALLPLRRRGSYDSPYPWVAMLPGDRLSDGVAYGIRVASVLAIAATIVALAAPYRAEVGVERVGEGAEIVLLLDRSRSMDQLFAGDARSTRWDAGAESKGAVARRLLAEFAAQRGHDRIGMIVFSTLPLPVIPLTSRHALVQAAIRAGDQGRGLAETDLGRGLLAALSYFEGRPYSGSRVILLVSDGGAEIDFETGKRIAQLMKRERVALCWLYLRSFGSPGLVTDVGAAGADPEAAGTEQRLHRFFEGLGVPYRVYDAESPLALERAVQDIDRLTSLPIRYTEMLPRSDLSRGVYIVALACSLLLFAARCLEIARWH